MTDCFRGWFDEGKNSVNYGHAARSDSPGISKVDEGVECGALLGGISLSPLVELQSAHPWH